jgi:hypothetical protein
MFTERVKTYYYRLMVFSLLSLFFIPYSNAGDSIYNATQIKLDILSPAIIAGTSKGALQHYEAAVNVRLAQRYYPTLELGYAGGRTTKGDSIAYNGHGGFFRVGVDICPLKKHPESPHALLVGIRLGTAVQDYSNGTDLRSGLAADCWGEIVLGCQVEIAKVNKTAFYMGWMGRVKFLFTRDKEGLPAADMTAVYIPGYGKRDNIGWGVNYYLGWSF